MKRNQKNWTGNWIFGWAAAALLLGTEAPLWGQKLEEWQVSGYTEYVSALLGVPFGAAERAQIRRDVEGYWAQGQRTQMKTVRETAQAWRELAQKEPDLLRVGMKMTLPDALLGLRKAARAGEADSQRLLDVYYRAFPPLAPGREDGLPLTREMVEADLYLKHWMASEIRRQKATLPDAKDVDAAVKAAVQEHGRLTAAQQVELARMPGEWARVRYGWQRASEIDRLITRSDLGGPLTAQERAAVNQVIAGMTAQIRGMASQHQSAMLNGAIEGMKKNSETIMGRGTVWNPATNRWEQQGGIVTEYNGVVRVP